MTLVTQWFRPPSDVEVQTGGYAAVIGPPGPEGISAGGDFGTTLIASEIIPAGSFVHIHASSGAKMRLASAADLTKRCHAYCADGASLGEVGEVLFGQVLSGFLGLTPGVDYWLATTPGQITDVIPSTDGNALQRIGVALSTTRLLFKSEWIGSV